MSINDRTRKHIYDIVEAGKAILAFTEGLTERAFLDNALVQAAVERKFEIVGESLNRIARDDEEVLVQISDYQRIIGFRNILAHGYDAIDQRLVWDAVRNHLPQLLREANRLLTSEASQ